MAGKHVPVYLPDETRAGTATINVETGVAVITIQSDSDLMEMLSEGIVGLSIVYLDAKKEKTDGR